MTDSLSVVGLGLAAWLKDHGPATTETIARHYTDHTLNGDEHLEAVRVIAAELRHLESLGFARRVRYDDSGRRSALWEAPKAGRQVGEKGNAHAEPRGSYRPASHRPQTQRGREGSPTPSLDGTDQTTHTPYPMEGAL